MKNNNIQSFGEFNEKLNISDVRSSKLSFDDYVSDIVDELNKRFDLTTKETLF
jgi:hypothetical protein